MYRVEIDESSCERAGIATNAYKQALLDHFGTSKISVSVRDKTQPDFGDHPDCVSTLAATGLELKDLQEGVRQIFARIAKPDGA